MATLPWEIQMCAVPSHPIPWDDSHSHPMDKPAYFPILVPKSWCSLKKGRRMKSFSDFLYNFSIFQKIQRAASKGPKSRNLATLAIDHKFYWQNCGIMELEE